MSIFEKNTKTGQAFEKTLVEGTPEELNELKSWLFKENIRLESERNEMKYREEKFLNEKQQFQHEMDEVNRKLVTERKRLKQDEMFFDKKMDILKNGFAQLDVERKKFETEKINFNARRDVEESYNRMDTAKMLFKGVKSQLALKKRYRDLLKMFHPDNIAGDHDMVLLINSAYEELKKEYDIKQA